VNRLGEKSGDNLRKFFKIASKNLLKWQLSVYQNSKQEVTEPATISTGNKEKKEKVNKYNSYKESTFPTVLSNYFLKVSPLSREEVFILRELVERYGCYLVEQAIDTTSSSSHRSFSHFLKALDEAVGESAPREPGLRSIRFRVRQRQHTLKNS
jgi:hypothetical protein